ncbi:MAG: HAD family phosphatase [Actinomycetaceae bacterium]|nr:HAD family phosphatase [Actinomycetaceae bacterium]
MTTVVFDLGQVVVDWDPYRTQIGFLSPVEWDEFLTRTDFWAFNQTLDAGRDLSEARQWFARHYPADVCVFDRYVARFPASIRGTVSGIESIINDLRAFSVPTAVLSNWPADLFHYALEQIPIIETLGHRIVSGEVGIVKPDRDIFELLLNQLDLRACNTVFIDDNLDNIEVALRVGIDAIHFTDATALREELVARRLIPHAGTSVTAHGRD